MIDQKELFRISDYVSIYEFASKEFDLSLTTVKNCMAISKRFADEHGRLLDQYQDFSYSSLVELIPLPDEDLNLFTPSMTVKEIREKKLVRKIVNSLDKAVNEKGFIYQFLDCIMSFDFDTELNLIGCELSYEANPTFYESKPYLSTDLNFEFSLTNSIRKIKRFEFSLEIYFYSSNVTFRIRDKDIWISGSFETLEELNQVLKNLCSAHLKNGLVIDDTKKNDFQEKSPGLEKVSDLRVWNPDDSVEISKKVIKESLPDLYVEPSSNYRSYDFYLEPKRNKKKNPLLYSIKNIDEPGKARIEVYNEDGTVKRTIPIFPDFKEVYDKKMKESIDDLNLYLKSSSIFCDEVLDSSCGE